MDKSVRLGIVTTHPIQYQAPLFRALNDRADIDLTVFFHHLPDAEQQGEGFGTAFTWDLPLLEGYRWKVLAREAASIDSSGPPTFSSFGEAYQDVDVMLIHGWQSPYMWRAWIRGVFSATPLLVRGESNAMRERPWWVKQLHRWYLRFFQRYLFIGESSRKFYKQAGAPEKALYPARYCVENERFNNDWVTFKSERQAIRSSLNIPSDATCFLFCGKFTPVKRTFDIIEGFNKTSKASEALMHLLMVGDGPMMEKAKQSVKEKDKVTFTGFLNQTEVSRVYTASDVIVLASDWETWGLVVNEAMIFESPALVSDRVGCGPDLVSDGRTGYTFPFGDTEALAERMREFAENPNHTAKMGREARNLVLNKYSISEAVNGIEQAIESLYI